MKRRTFIDGLGSAAAWPIVARAQQRAMPVIGVLANGVPENTANPLAAFRKVLSETGFVEGRNVTIVANNALDRLPEAVAGPAKSVLRPRMTLSF
jgi:putative tryptophan/tyrosine transport system substrate-binding protein